MLQTIYDGIVSSKRKQNVLLIITHLKQTVVLSYKAPSIASGTCLVSEIKRIQLIEH